MMIKHTKCIPPFLGGFFAVLLLLFQIAQTNAMVWQTSFPAWHLIASPNPAQYGNLLSGVSAISANDVWAVGSTQDLFNGSRAFTLHWNGQQWQQQAIETPASFITVAHLTGVVALSAHNVWVVGSYLAGLSTHTLIEHWDGSRWAIIPSPNPGSRLNILNNIAAVSVDNVWAVGEYSSGSDGSSQTLLMHWNGHVWSTVGTNANLGFINLYSGVSARAANDVWLTGSYLQRGSSTSTIQPLAVHWDGHRWSRVSAPRPEGSSGAVLQNISAVPGTHEFWAVGSYYVDDSHTLRTLIEHWNGHVWSIVSSPNVGDADNDLMSISVLNASNIWTVGTASENGVGHGLVEHWNGHQWSPVGVPHPGPDNTLHTLSSVTRVPGTRQFWLVGFYGNGNGKAVTLTERYS